VDNLQDAIELASQGKLEEAKSAFEEILLDNPKTNMQTRLSCLLFVMLTLSIASTGCVRTAATWQPDMQQVVTVTQATLNPKSTIGMMLFTPGKQVGKSLDITYANNSANNGVICLFLIEQLEPGNNGSTTWTFKNTQISQGELNFTATVVPTPAGGNGSANYIGIKLKADDTYLLGDSSTFVPLAKLISYPKDRPQLLASGTSTNYKLEWQVASPVMKAGPDGLFGTVDDTPVDGTRIKQDRTQLNINFNLTPKK
jgi:hypothetical protein